MWVLEWFTYIQNLDLEQFFQMYYSDLEWFLNSLFIFSFRLQVVHFFTDSECTVNICIYIQSGSFTLEYTETTKMRIQIQNGSLKLCSETFNKCEQHKPHWNWSFCFWFWNQIYYRSDVLQCNLSLKSYQNSCIFCHSRSTFVIILDGSVLVSLHLNLIFTIFVNKQTKKINNLNDSMIQSQLFHGGK